MIRSERPRAARALPLRYLFGWGGLLCLLACGCRPGSQELPGASSGPEAAPESVRPASSVELAEEHRRLVEELSRVVKDQRVLAVLARVPRHEFVPSAVRQRSYVNTALEIEERQTISAPDIVALMTEALALQGTEKVLEIGTGSGYQAAVLGELVPEVYTVEIRHALAERARRTLRDLKDRGVLHYRTLEVLEGDGFRGHPPAAPYDAIIVTAAPRQVPVELINQLRPGGRMVIPVGDFYQELQLIRKAEDGRFTTEIILPVRFVRMVSSEEQKE